MAEDWLEALEKSTAKKIQPVVVPAVDNADEKEITAEQPVVPAVKVKAPQQRSSRKRPSSTLALSMTTGVLLAIGVGSLVAINQLTSSDDRAPEPTSAQSSVVEESAALPGTSALTTADPASVGNKCTSATPEVATEKSVRAAITEFETAYFSRDSQRLISSTTETSPLRNQNWDAVLAEAAPDGTTWCAELGAVTDTATTVDVDLTMAVPGQPAKTYKQRATGENTSQGWKLVALEART